MNASFEYMNAMAREYERQGTALRRELNALRAKEAADARGQGRGHAKVRQMPVLRLPRLAFRRA